METLSVTFILPKLVIASVELLISLPQQSQPTQLEVRRDFYKESETS